MNKVEEYIRNNRMIDSDDLVIAGVSGGADSICLLFLLEGLQKKLNFTLAVCHINHGIRTDASDDEAYVKSICQKLGVSFFTLHADVPALSVKWKLSEEETGRKVRYEFFDRVAREEYPDKYKDGKVKIAVAHHANDRAETFLLNLFRGTGLKGLESIQPVRGNVIRPLLTLHRNEIESYLKERNIEFCTDSTNAEDTYLRNKVRNRIIPYVEEEISPRVIERINNTADLVKEADRFIDKQVCLAEERCMESAAENEVTFDCQKLLEEDPYIQSKLILKGISRVTDGAKDIGAVHVRAVLLLLATEGSHSVDLPYRVKAKKIYNKLSISAEEKIVLDENEEIEFLKDMEMNLEVKGLGKITVTSFPCDEGKMAVIPQNKCTKWFDYDKINKSLKIRKRLQGDYLIINEAGNKKSLQDYMVDEKIPREERDSIRVVADQSHVLWVIGHRISSGFKVGNNTSRILQIRLEEKDYD